MAEAKLTPFGREIKIKLLNLGKNQNWLIGEVKEKTGLYFDSSYLRKIMVGTLATPSIIHAICEILGMEVEATSRGEEEMREECGQE